MFNLYQTSRQECDWITNINHESIKLNQFDKLIIKYMNGSNCLNDIKNKVIIELKANNHTIKKNGKAISNEKEIDTCILDNIKSTLHNITRKGVLI